MDIDKIILKKLKEQKEIKVSDIVEITGFSRAYISKAFKKLKESNKIFQVGKANRATYVLVKNGEIDLIRKKILKSKKILKNKNLSESDILEEIKKETGIFLNLSGNVSDILDYSFTEILNNAIEHSRSEKISIIIERRKNQVIFEIADFGIGIFKNIIRKRKLKNELEAIQDLLKGKQTTDPKRHTGEGIFFTSKASDKLTIQSFKKKLIIDNILDDIFIEDVKGAKGTIVKFEIETKTRKNLGKLFKKYSEKLFDFDKTEVTIELYIIDTSYISRSQARRVLSGLNKFKKIILDFKNVKTVGQAFADEVFRVWKNKHKDINIVYKNANKNIVFFIERAKK